MRTPSIFLRILIAAHLLMLVSCGSIKEPEFKAIENFRLGHFGLNESNFNLELHYFNPNNSRLQLKKAEGKVWMDNNFLGNFLVDTLVRIPANADFRLPVKLKVDMSKIVKNSISILLSRDVQIRIEGTARVGKSGLFIRYPIRYEGKLNVGELIK